MAPFDDDLEVGRPSPIGVFRAIGVGLALNIVSIPLALVVAGAPLLRLGGGRSARRARRRS